MKKVFDIKHFADTCTVDYANDLYMLVRIIAVTGSMLGLENLQGMTLEEADKYCEEYEMNPVSEMSEDLELFFVDEDKHVKLDIQNIHRVLAAQYASFLVEDLILADTPEKVETIADFLEVLSRLPQHTAYMESDGYLSRPFEELSSEERALVLDFAELQITAQIFNDRYMKGGE